MRQRKQGGVNTRQLRIENLEGRRWMAGDVLPLADANLVARFSGDVETAWAANVTANTTQRTATRSQGTKASSVETEPPVQENATYVLAVDQRLANLSGIPSFF